MNDSHDYFDVEQRGTLGILRLRPSREVALSNIHYTHALLHAIERFSAESMSVLLVCVPPGNFDSERMTQFWDTARGSLPDEPVRGARHPHPPGVPTELVRLENGVVQVLRLLRRVDLFKIVAFEGEVDFDLLGLLLAFDARLCDQTTVIENRTLERGVTPGFGVLWYLAQYVGQATTLHLVLNRRSLSAD